MRRAMKASSFSRISSAAGWMCKRSNAYEDLLPATGRQHPRIHLIPWTFRQVGPTHRHLLSERGSTVGPAPAIPGFAGVTAAGARRVRKRSSAKSRAAAMIEVCLMRVSVVLTCCSNGAHDPVAARRTLMRELRPPMREPRPRSSSKVLSARPREHRQERGMELRQLRYLP